MYNKSIVIFQWHGTVLSCRVLTRQQYRTNCVTYSIQFTSTISIHNRHIINKTYITENLEKNILMLILFLFEFEEQTKLNDKNEYVRISFGAVFENQFPILTRF